MGNKNSRPSDCASSKEVETALRKPALAALKLARQNPVGNLSFEKLLLNFPQLEDGFLKLEKAFHEASGEAAAESTVGKTVTVPEVRKIRQSVGIQIDEASLHQLFPQRHDPGLALTFNDVVVALAILVIHVGPEKAVEQGADQDVVKTLMLAVNSFNHFDKDGNGSLVQEEVTGTMGEVDNSAHAKRTVEPGAGSGDIQQRWKLMDVDKDGRANFQDYVRSLHNWVLN